MTRYYLIAIAKTCTSPPSNFSSTVEIHTHLHLNPGNFRRRRPPLRLG